MPQETDFDFSLTICKDHAGYVTSVDTVIGSLMLVDLARRQGFASWVWDERAGKPVAGCEDACSGCKWASRCDADGFLDVVTNEQLNAEFWAGFLGE